MSEYHSEREWELEYALLLMVYQYCNRGEVMDHEYMSAGENAFSALDIEDNEPAENVWKRIEEMEEERGENGFGSSGR